MLRIFAAAAALALGLAGCTLGIAPGTPAPSGDYKLGVSYQDAYKSAVAQARLCLTGDDAYKIENSLDTVGRTAQVRVVAPFTSNDIARVDIAAIDDRNSQVKVVMWGRGIWNADAVIAMRDAIRFNLPACASYMPSDAVKPLKAPR
jgi:hypothetical protein